MKNCPRTIIKTQLFVECSLSKNRHSCVALNEINLISKFQITHYLISPSTFVYCELYIRMSRNMRHHKLLLDALIWLFFLSWIHQ
jgi:hypothetical protein